MCFLCDAPTIWYQLPITIKFSETTDSFPKNKREIYLFETAFPPYIFAGSMFQLQLFIYDYAKLFYFF